MNNYVDVRDMVFLLPAEDSVTVDNISDDTVYRFEFIATKLMILVLAILPLVS